MQDKSTGEMRNLKSKKLYLQVYDELCSYIKENDLGPGDKLPTEVEMTQMLGVSRNVLREAIKALEITGVITSKPGVGITICKKRSDLLLSGLISQVNAMNDENAKTNIEELRSVLELGFCKKAFDNITPEQISTLTAQVKIMREQSKALKSSGKQNVDSCFAQADALFHSTLFEKTDNPLLSSILSLFWASESYFKIKMVHSSMDQTVSNHENILEALKNGNFDEFHSAMLQHFSLYKSAFGNLPSDKTK